MDTREELINYIESIKGKSVLLSPEVRKIYELYNKTFNRNETPNFCSSCLVDFIKKVKRELGI